jgi:chromosome partitioning protein
MIHPAEARRPRPLPGRCRSVIAACAAIGFVLAIVIWPHSPGRFPGETGPGPSSFPGKLPILMGTRTDPRGLDGFPGKAMGRYNQMTGPITVAMLNRKGGCGKTSTCHHLAGAFAKDGLRVLLVDMDPQASLTQGLFGPQATEALPDRSTVVGLFDDSFDPDPDAIIQPTPFERISIVPGSNALDDFNVPRPQETGEIQLTLRRFLKEARDSYDVALIDCPPNLSLCSWAALLAADSVVVPVQAEDYGAQGIVYIQRAFDLALAHHNPRLRLAGYLVTMFNKSLGIHAAYDHQLRSLYGDQVFQTTVPLAKDFKEAVAARQPVATYKPRSAAAKSIKAVADELLERAEAAKARPSEFLYLGHRVGPKDLPIEAVADLNAEEVVR